MSDWPRHGNGPGIPAVFKSVPEDFRVDERLSFVPEGTGEHCFVRLEKVGLTTRDVQLDLARHHGLPPLDVGYAGMKDKHALARQWFSLRGVEEPSAPADRAMKILETSRHPKKLRRGELGGNRFAVRLRGVASEDRGAAESGLRALADQGAPNYFGPQRFGENNLEAARQWLAGRRRAERPDGRRRGRRRAGGARFLEGLHIEARVLSCHGDIRHGLEHAGVSQSRRPLVLEADGLEWRIVDAPDGSLTVEVEFGLPAGGYATSLLGEVFELVPAVAGAAAA